LVLEILQYINLNGDTFITEFAKEISEMKAFFYLTILLLSCNSTPDKTVNALKQDVTANLTDSLVWYDEFSYSGLPDSTKWNYDVGGTGWGNNEDQYYTEKRLQNARVNNGNLIIEARREEYRNKNYTSARLVTKGKGDWRYGRIEVRAKIPRGRGTWPAIWMLASTTPLRWPRDGEIDIMEHVGFDQGNIHATIHCTQYNHGNGRQRTAIAYVPDCADSFHVYSLLWTMDTIKAAIDNRIYFTFSNEHTDATAWPFDFPFHLLLNIAIGGNWGGQRGIDNNIFPVRMEVDYVRVYR
jgi:beta-glucanase (GH16 family)